MSKTPSAAPRTEGRIFDKDWSVANVARLLRSNAGRGVWRHVATTGGSSASVNQYYLRTVSAFHLPSSASLIFMRLERENCFYLSLCFAGNDEYLPWNPETAELWLWALFGEDRPRVHEAADATGTVRQFTLPMGE
ncbi:MAG: hypothetical protein NTW28_11760 [Candidatus Solibacter sp.]|nr:hypothetical protein [Candidatus Solibacter sp.]